MRDICVDFTSQCNIIDALDYALAVGIAARARGPGESCVRGKSPVSDSGIFPNTSMLATKSEMEFILPCNGLLSITSMAPSMRAYGGGGV